LVDAPANSGKAITSYWIVFTVNSENVTFLGLFHGQHNAEAAAAKIEGARVERVPLREERSAAIPDIKALIG
jgi:hypothetical protein